MKAAAVIGAAVLLAAGVLAWTSRFECYPWDKRPGVMTCFDRWTHQVVTKTAWGRR